MTPLDEKVKRCHEALTLFVKAMWDGKPDECDMHEMEAHAAIDDLAQAMQRGRPNERDIHAACPLCSGDWLNYTPEQHDHIFCKCDGFHATVQDAFRGLPVPAYLPPPSVHPRCTPAPLPKRGAHDICGETNIGCGLPNCPLPPPEPLPSSAREKVREALTECKASAETFNAWKIQQLLEEALRGKR